MGCKGFIRLENRKCAVRMSEISNDEGPQKTEKIK